MSVSLAKTICVLLCGKAGVGKTTSANFLKKEFEARGYVVEIARFASGVKSVARFMGWNGEKDCSGRKLLQTIGQAGRAYNKDIWVSATFDHIIPEMSNYPQDIVIVDDYRFPNESDVLRSNPLYQVFEVRIESPEREMLKGTPEYEDVSETSLPSGPSEKYFKTLNNLSTLEDLENMCKTLVTELEDSSEKW